MTRLLRAAAVLIALAACSGLSRAKSATNTVADGPSTVLRPLRFGLTADYPPFALRDARGELTGADVEAARRIARVLGARAEFVITSWSTLAQDFERGRFDVALGGLTVTSERAALGIYSRTLLHDGKRALVRCADRARYPTAESLNRSAVRVAINRGPSMPAVVKEFFPHATLVVNADHDALLASLRDGQVDAWVTDGVVVDHMARRYVGVLCAASPPTPFTHVEKAWLIRRDDPALVAAIDRELSLELSSGRWQRDLEAVR